MPRQFKNEEIKEFAILNHLQIDKNGFIFFYHIQCVPKSQRISPNSNFHTLCVLSKTFCHQTVYKECTVNKNIVT